MKTNNQIILKKKKGQWWNIATNKPFSGLASVNGQTFLYTKDGRKIPQSKPAPNIHNFIKNLWMRENPENKGFTKMASTTITKPQTGIGIQAQIQIKPNKQMHSINELYEVLPQQR